MRQPEIDASEIEVTVESGEVTLTGTVDNRRIKHLVEDIAEGISGVKDVNNQLRVNRGSTMAGGGSNSWGTSGRTSDTSSSTTGKASGITSGPSTTGITPGMSGNTSTTTGTSQSSRNKSSSSSS